MIGQRHTISNYDHCVYYCKLSESTFIYLLSYVDDMLIYSNSKVEIDRLKAQLSKEFEMKDLGKAEQHGDQEIESRVGYVCLKRHI